MIHCHYSECSTGQLHWREWVSDREQARDSAQPLLLCLHPAPYSGLYFTTIMPLLATGRRIVAPDYPGYGGSTPPVDAHVDIATYARTMLELVDELQADGPVHVLGFHTGCLVAAEMSLLAPERINRQVLVDVPYFTGDVQAQMLERAAQPLPLNGQAASVAGLWDAGVGRRLEAMPLERAVELLAEQLRVSSRAHWAFRAAFTYDCEQQMALVRTPTRVIATSSGLLEATRGCAAQIPGAQLVERLDITRAVFEEGALAIVSSIIDGLA